MSVSVGTQSSKFKALGDMIELCLNGFPQGNPGTVNKVYFKKIIKKWGIKYLQYKNNFWLYVSI